MWAKFTSQTKRRRRTFRRRGRQRGGSGCGGAAHERSSGLSGSGFRHKSARCSDVGTATGNLQQVGTAASPARRQAVPFTQWRQPAAMQWRWRALRTSQHGRKSASVRRSVASGVARLRRRLCQQSGVGSAVKRLKIRRSVGCDVARCFSGLSTSHTV
ncbi:hypothetical protein PHJA_000216000 [Phtheirospermum japonicum]|uniref:Uncharacterized protein n=1 Tax=Phtheirospermum japonicum TaxID=374723 RepID=A0A830B105_9LAMI|nr:hypothetical protein PHJA_000216000 [Phtheirospermum japonicum]